MSVYRVIIRLITSFLLIYSVYCVKLYQWHYLKEKPCAARAIDGESVICVCNSTYCDEFVKDMPGVGQYVAYTSSKAGLRFRKSYGIFKSHTQPKKCITTLNLDPRKKHQRVEGFGAAITDSAGINIMSLPSHMRDFLINSYFSSYGLEYNMLRVPIGGTDFSTRSYTYNEFPPDDPYLTNYTLSYEDYFYKLPIIKQCSKVAISPVHIVGSVWTPPDWMKDWQGPGLNRLKDKYLQTYALYFLRFLELYSENGVKLWAITTTNEPLNDVLPLGRDMQHLGWTTDKMGHWIVNNLGPTIRNSEFKDVKILAVDDQRFSIPIWFNFLVSFVPGAEKYIDGVAVHAYTDRFTPALLLKETMRNYPNIFVISTEASEGVQEKRKVILGSWERAQSYIIDILEDLCNDVVGWIDWNMCLDMNGGPNWIKNYVDSPIIVNAKRQEFYKQPMFYAMGHFAKFLKRDSRRIEITNKTICPITDTHNVNSPNKIDELNLDDEVASYDSVAFQTPHNTIVVVIHNRGPETPVVIKCGNKQATLQLEASSITTVEFQAIDCYRL